MNDATGQQIAAQGQALDAAKWELPKRYRLQSELLSLPPEELKKRDPEMFALWERTKEEQAKLAAAAALPYGQMSPQDAERARSVTIVKSLRATLADLNRRISAVILSGEERDLGELQAAKIAVRHQLAERWAIVGRYDLAAETEPDKAYRDEYLAILGAVWRDDSETCSCETVHRGSGEHSNISVPTTFVKADIFSLKHAKVVSLMKCPCGFMNAIETPAHIIKQRAGRARALQMARHLSIDDAAVTLRAAGLTTQAIVTTNK